MYHICINILDSYIHSVVSYSIETSRRKRPQRMLHAVYWVIFLMGRRGTCGIGMLAQTLTNHAELDVKSHR